MLGQLAASERYSGRIVPLALHVDYFNNPWKDPFSDPKFSAREMDYNRVYNRDRKRADLFFTPMLMIDGRYPMLGSDRARAQEALAKVLAEAPGVTLTLALEEVEAQPLARSLQVTIGAKASGVAGRKLLVGVATFEDPLTTRVQAGENRGKTLTDHFAVRRLAHEFILLSKAEPKTLTFPVELEPDWKPERCGVAVFVQDEETGRVYQAATLPWPLENPRGRLKGHVEPRG